MAKRKKKLTTSAGAPVADNQNSLSAGARGPLLLQDYQLLEKLAHQNRERIPERVVHAKGWGAHGTFTVTKDISRYSRARLFSKVGKQTPLIARFSTVAGEAGAADALMRAKIWFLSAAGGTSGSSAYGSKPSASSVSRSKVSLPSRSPSQSSNRRSRST